EVATQPISSKVAPKLPAICGSATLTIVVSSTSMIAAVIRPNRISQRCLFSSASAASLTANESAGAAEAPDVRDDAVTAQLVSHCQCHTQARFARRNDGVVRTGVRKM